MRSPIAVISGISLLVIFASAGGCGGAIASIGDDAGGQDDTLGDGGFHSLDGGTGLIEDTGSVVDGEALGTGCPVATPHDGAGCSNSDLTCEYGGVGPHLRCSTVFACQAVGNEAAKWNARPPAPDCVGSQMDNAPSCPASFSALPSDSTCPSNTGSACVYPEGVCECAPCESPDGGGSENLWSCKLWPVAQGSCPSPRPRLGSACTMEDEACYYGAWCDRVNFDEPAMSCKMGRWHDEPGPLGPPCPFPFCGQ